MRLFFSILALLAGSILMLPFASTFPGHSPFGPAVFRPLVQVSLDDLRKGPELTLRFRMPTEEELGANDLERAWIVFAAGGQNRAHCWQPLQIRIQAFSGKGPVVPGGSGNPYAWSTLCTTAGLWFPAQAGEEVELRLGSEADHLPEGEIQIRPYWRTNEKDRIVGDAISKYLKQISWFATPVSLILLAAGARGLLK